jgi:hypothetical protein
MGLPSNIIFQTSGRGTFEVLQQLTAIKAPMALVHIREMPKNNKDFSLLIF